MAFPFSLSISSFVYLHTWGFVLFLCRLMGEGSCVPHPFPSFILKLRRKRTSHSSHSSNFISPYPTPFDIFVKNSVSQRFPLKRLFLDLHRCGRGWGSVGRQRKPDSKDRLSFVPQWTINRLT